MLNLLALFSFCTGEHFDIFVIYVVRIIHRTFSLCLDFQLELLGFELRKCNNLSEKYFCEMDNLYSVRTCLFIVSINIYFVFLIGILCLLQVF